MSIHFHLLQFIVLSSCDQDWHVGESESFRETLRSHENITVGNQPRLNIFLYFYKSVKPIKYRYGVG